MAKGEASKVWIVPSDFGAALQGFTKMLGAPGEDGVFRYASPVGDLQAGGRLRGGRGVVYHADRPGDRAGRRQGRGRRA